MTGLEAVKELKDIGIRAAGCEVALVDYPEIKEMLDTIENDLEILKKLKDIEKEIGVNLGTLFNALNCGIYAKDAREGAEDKISFFDVSLYSSNIGLTLIEETPIIIKNWFLLKDYGKTWALTKEEMEDENN